MNHCTNDFHDHHLTMIHQRSQVISTKPSMFPHAGYADHLCEDYITQPVHLALYAYACTIAAPAAHADSRFNHCSVHFVTSEVYMSLI